MSRKEVVFKNGDRYEGELSNQQPHGKGTYIFRDGSHFTGEFAHGLFHGHGCLLDTFSDISVQGNFFEGTPQGNCKVTYPDGSLFEGPMKMGYRDVYGTVHFGPSSPYERYKGSFSEDEMEGQGELVMRDGTLFIGKFETGVPHGEIEITHEKYSYVGNMRKGTI